MCCEGDVAGHFFEFVMFCFVVGTWRSEIREGGGAGEGKEMAKEEGDSRTRI